MRFWRDGGSEGARLFWRSRGGRALSYIQKPSRKGLCLDQIHIRQGCCSLYLALPLKGTLTICKDWDRLAFLLNLTPELLSCYCCVWLGFQRLSRHNSAGDGIYSATWLLQRCSWRWTRILVLPQRWWSFWATTELLVMDQVCIPLQDQDLAIIPPLLSIEKNEALIKPPSMAELKEAVFSQLSDKTPGPDEFSIDFYKQFWSYCWVKDRMSRIRDMSLNNVSLVLMMTTKFVI